MQPLFLSLVYIIFSIEGFNIVAREWLLESLKSCLTYYKKNGYLANIRFYQVTTGLFSLFFLFYKGYSSKAYKIVDR